MPTWLYYSRPSNLAFHNKYGDNLPVTVRSLLGLGLNFCIQERRTGGINTVDIDRFKRDAHTRMFFAGKDRPKPALFFRSSWTPPSNKESPLLRSRIAAFGAALGREFRSRPCASNLLPQQVAAINFLRTSDAYVWATDKNLGPIVTTVALYLERCWNDHLSDRLTYRQLTEAQFRTRVNVVRNLHGAFLAKYFPPNDDDRTFLERSFNAHRDKFPHFYIVAKIHKTPWATRPIVSTCGTHVEGIGRWVDRQLQAIVRHLPHVAKSSFDVLQTLQQLPPLPAGARLFTADARSMYTNIKTSHALQSIEKFLAHRTDICAAARINSGAVCMALRIVMIHNVFTFGDTFWVQQQGTAMGVAPGPAYATLYFAIHEMTFNYAELRLYFRYIDDVIGIWVPDLSQPFEIATWTAFKSEMDAFGMLRWDFTPRSMKVTYLDMELTLSAGRIRSRCVDRVLNLHLYLPPHSAHPSGVLRAQIRGAINRITRLTTEPKARLAQIRLFRQRMLRRGYAAEAIDPLFRSESAPTTAVSISTTTPADNKGLFLHVDYHPLAPKRADIQRAFRRTVAFGDDGGGPLAALLNHCGVPLGVDRLTVAYHRPRNLRQLVARSRFPVHGAVVSAAFARLDVDGAVNPNPVLHE